MNKWHINKNGIPKICKATKRKCPLGEHFENQEQAQIYLDNINESKPISKYLTKTEYTKFIKSINFNKEIENLTKYSNEFIKTHFGLNKLDIPIRFDGKLKGKMGLFRHTKDKGLDIVISKEEFINAKIIGKEKEVILTTLGHELVHYSLFKQGKPFDDGDEEFEFQLKKLNLPSSSETPIEKRKSTAKNAWTHKTNTHLTPEGKLFPHGGAYNNRETIKNTIIIREDGTLYTGNLETIGYTIDYYEE